MDILVAHNFYKQAGGEDECVAAEVALLRAYGHKVTEYYLHNDALDKMGRLEALSRTIWSRPAFHELQQLLRKERPQIAHFHNTFPLISPAAYYAAQAEDVRVVQTLHNFRLVCANAILFRQGAVCEDCLGKTIPWPGVLRKCYRDSYVASAGVVAMLTAHRAIGTWRNLVDVYVALTESSRSKLVVSGLPAEKIAVKPNFAYPDPGVGAGKGGYGVYVGRLSAEKGVDTLLRAWRIVGETLPLKVVGDGPLASQAREAASGYGGVQLLGHLPLSRVYELIGDATVLVLPSQCQETFARVAMEAFAKGTPVIASRLGAMAEIVEDGATGLHFHPGDATDLAEKVRALLSDPLRLARMRQSARLSFERRFTAEANHNILMSIYRRALEARPARRPADVALPA
jgi:glycosyltransferase involved in cell wall biosynthesis